MAVTALDTENESPYAKRRKMTHESSPPHDRPSIDCSTDLQRLLAFEQNADSGVKQKVQTFKSFLGQVQNSQNPDTQAAKRSILLDFLYSKKPRSADDSATAFSDLIQTWHYAVQVNVESLCSSISAVFALLLKSISSLLDFREPGRVLCRQLLHEDQMSLFDRSLKAHKEHLIDSCIRLLTELVQFDGGSCANILHRRRETVFQRLDKFLLMQSNDNDNNGEDGGRRRPSVRESAFWYLNANLRLQSGSAKGHLLRNARVARAWTRPLSADPFWMVQKTLVTMVNEVLNESSIDQHTRQHFFSSSLLEDVSALYNYKAAKDDSSWSQMRETVHRFFLQLLTSPTNDMLRIPQRQHSKGANLEDAANVDGDDRDKHIDRKNPPGLRKSVIPFLQHLRPYADTLQCDLITDVFRCEASLIHDYFATKKFSFDPKLTATWVGYARFLLAVVQLPVTESVLRDGVLNHDLGQVFLSCLLPNPMQLDTLTRCLNQSSQLITFISVNILNAAFINFNQAMRKLAALQDFTHQAGLRERLIAMFASRCPDIKHVMAQFRSASKENQSFKESITRLLSLYFQVIPEIALEEKFDISTVLSDLLEEISQFSSSRRLELEHLLEIAVRSPSMTWWHKPGNMRLSPFTALLRSCALSEHPNDDLRTKQILDCVGQENGILGSSPNGQRLNILIASLRPLQGLDVNDVYGFLDNTILRLVQRPLAYAELLKGLSSYSTDCDLLLVALAEQWQFLVQQKPSSVQKTIAAWLVSHLRLTSQSVGYASLAREIGEILRNNTSDEDVSKTFKKIYGQRGDLEIDQNLETTDTFNDPMQIDDLPASARHNEEGDLRDAWGSEAPPVEKIDHPEIQRWNIEEVEDAISDSMIGDLALCLCSQHKAVRFESLQALRAFMCKLTESTYAERHMPYLVVGELVESAANQGTESPLPYLAGVLAAQLIQICADPLHFMYTKACRFLMKGPMWNVEKLPSYWVDKIMLREPTNDDTYQQEIKWLLDVLHDALRTPADMELYRRCNVFEYLLSMAGSLMTPEIHFDAVVRCLFRCAFIDGSTTLITRYGLFSWIASKMAQKKGISRERLLSLARKLYDTADKGRISEWSDGSLGNMLQTMQERIL